MQASKIMRTRLNSLAVVHFEIAFNHLEQCRDQLACMNDLQKVFEIFILVVIVLSLSPTNRVVII